MERLEQIPHYVGQYARGRRASIPLLLGLAVYGTVFVAIAGFSKLTGEAYRAGHHPLFELAVAGMVASVAGNLWLAVPRWGGRRFHEWVQRVSGTGDVQLAKPSIRPRFPVAVSIAFAACVLASVFAGHHIPFRYMQPVSALYCVPFAIYIAYSQRAPRLILWPALYALHAILLVLGAPILFTGRWESLNMYLPTFGYGAIAALASYANSHYALARLKRLTACPAEDAHGGH